MTSNQKAKSTAANPSEAAPSLYERLGGDAALLAVIEQFYERVLEDPALQPFFVGISMKWMKERQRRFFTQALGGPAIYNGRTMRAAHASLAIEPRHFNLVAKHLIQTLEANSVPQGLIEETAERIMPLATEIVNTAPSEPEALGAATL